MNKNEKYEKIAELFFERIIILEKELRNMGERLEKDCKNNITKVYIELGDFIPLVELAEILEIPNINLESTMYEEINKLYKKGDNLKSRVQKFLEKYVELF